MTELTPSAPDFPATGFPTKKAALAYRDANFPDVEFPKTAALKTMNDGLLAAYQAKTGVGQDETSDVKPETGDGIEDIDTAGAKTV